LKLYVEESHALPIVSIAVALRTGAAADPPGKDGLTRITSRMLRRGCRGLASHEIEERIDTLGADLAVDVSSSVVTIHGEVITRSLEPFVELVCRLLSEPAFDEQELGRLLREAQAELIESRDSDRALAGRHFRRTLFAGHPYARRISGQLATLSSITRDDVVRHYETQFGNEDVHVAFAGDVTEEHARKLAERLVGALPAAKAERVEVTSPPARQGRRLVFVDKPERTQTQIMIGCIGAHPVDQGFLPLHVATTIFGGTFTSRLMNEIRSKRGWSYGAYARLAYDRTRDSFSLWTFPAAKDAAGCIALELELLDAWHAQGITPRELAFAKKYMVRSHAFDLDTAEKRVHLKLDIDLYDLPADYHTGYVEHVEGTSVASANEAVTSLVSPKDLVIAVVGTHGEIGEAVARSIPDLAEVQVVPFDLE
jgi:zinc protease